MKNVNVDGRIIAKWNFKKNTGRASTELIWFH